MASSLYYFTDTSWLKMRTGPPVDDEEDYGLRVWAGVLPIATVTGPPVPDPRLINPQQAPEYLSGVLKKKP